MKKYNNSSSFSTGQGAQEKGLPYVPECYKAVSEDSIPSCESNPIPVIDFSRFKQGAQEQNILINEIRNVCSQLGFFQIVKHGISQATLDDALATSFEFFEQPASEKMKLMSSDVHKPVRYGTSLKDGVDEVQFWRVFLKHYAHPLDQWINSWPQNPPDYREKMGKYCKEVKELSVEITRAITEALGLGATYLDSKTEQGMQVVAVNCYPPCPNPETALGLPPHSDYSCLTILLQSSPGLEILDPRDGSWKPVPAIPGALQVHIGDHFQALSNGIFKSIVHRVTLNNSTTRISVASLHSLGLDDKVGPAPELVAQKKKYKESSVKDFLDFLNRNDLSKGGTFMDTLKLED